MRPAGVAREERGRGAWQGACTARARGEVLVLVIMRSSSRRSPQLPDRTPMRSQCLSSATLPSRVEMLSTIWRWHSLPSHERMQALVSASRVLSISRRSASSAPEPHGVLSVLLSRARTAGPSRAMSLVRHGRPRLLSGKTHCRPRRTQRLHCSVPSTPSHLTLEVRQPRQLLVLGAPPPFLSMPDSKAPSAMARRSTRVGVGSPLKQ